MPETTKRGWEVWLEIATPVLTVAMIILNFVEFRISEANNVRLESKKDDLQFRRRLWTELLETCGTVSGLAGKIAVTPIGPDRAKEVIDFEGAYWGGMAIVEDASVKNAMKEYHIELNAAAMDLKPNPERLKVRAQFLAVACDKSLKDGKPPT